MLPEHSLKIAFFHEAGHVFNTCQSKIGKVLQKARNLSVLTLPILLIGILKNKKSPNEKPGGIFDKTTTFIKDNVGKLVFLSSLPLLLVEGLASLHAQKFAKNLLSPELARKVAKSNCWGFLSYLISTIGVSTGIWLGVKIKDSIAKPTPVVSK